MTGRWIDAGIRFFLYALIFWLPYSSAAVEICVIGAGILWIVKRILLLKSSNRTISGILKIFTPVQNPLNRWIGGFLFIAFLASLGSLDPAESLSNLFTKTFEWFAVYFLVLEVFNQKKHWQIAGTVFLITSAMVLADGLIQSYITQKDFFRGHVIDPGGRVTSSLETANGLGAYLTVLIPVGLAFLSIEWKQRLRNTVFLLFFIISMWVLVLTFSRAAWLGVLIGMAFFLFLTKKVFLKKRSIIGILLLLGFYGILVMNQSNQIFSKDRVTSLGWRTVIWRNSLVMIKERPFFGHGINTYMKLLPYYQEGKSKQNPSYAHNCFLQLAVETGLLGLSAFLGMMITMFRETITGIMTLQRTNGEVARLILGLLSGCLAFLIQSFFDTNLYSLKLSVYFWLIVGMIFSLYNLFCTKENCGINNV